MHLTILCSSFAWGGLEINIVKLALWWQQYGHQSLVLAPQGSPAFAFCEEHDIPVRDFQLKKRYLAFGEARYIARVMEQHQSEVLLVSHSKHIEPAIWVRYFSKKSIKVLYWQQMNLGVSKKDPLHTFFYRQLSAWIAPLPSIAQQALSKTLLKASQVRVIPLGIDFDLFAQAAQQKASARQKLALPQEAYMVGIVGRLDPGKDQATVMKAVHLLQSQGKEAHLLIVGEETKGDTRRYAQHLRDLEQSLGIKNVYFRDFQSAPEWAFAALDVFVMASIDETYGMVTLEAMAAGLPVAGAKAGGTIALIEEGQTGFFYPTADAEALAAVLAHLYENPQIAQQVAQQAQAFAQAYYTHEAMCKRLQEILEV